MGLFPKFAKQFCNPFVKNNIRWSVFFKGSPDMQISRWGGRFRHQGSKRKTNGKDINLLVAPPRVRLVRAIGYQLLVQVIDHGSFGKLLIVVSYSLY